MGQENILNVQSWEMNSVLEKVQRDSVSGLEEISRSESSHWGKLGPNDKDRLPQSGDIGRSQL